jgi:hypothetical protein
MNFQTRIIFRGAKAAVISNIDGHGPFDVRLWVNCKDGQPGSITPVTARTKTLKGAMRSAQRILKGAR